MMIGDCQNSKGKQERGGDWKTKKNQKDGEGGCEMDVEGGV